MKLVFLAVLTTFLVSRENKFSVHHWRCPLGALKKVHLLGPPTTWYVSFFLKDRSQKHSKWKFIECKITKRAKG